MKKLVILYFLFPIFAFSQNYHSPLNLPNYDLKTVHFGFLLGINNLDFKITKNPDVDESLFVLKSQDQKGFNMGVISNFRLNRNLDFRITPTLSLAERKIMYVIEENNVPIEEKKSIESTFIEMPLSLKFKSERYNNGRVYMLTGLKYSLDLASLRNINDEGLELVKIKENDISYEIGLGLDFYLEFFKFSTELKGSFGLFNLINKDESIYSNSIESLKSRGFTVTFTFE
ncbi:MAG: porin family protein [Flavobacteriales bacterium]